MTRQSRNKTSVDERIAELRRERSLAPGESLVINPFAESDINKAMEMEDLIEALLAEEEYLEKQTGFRAEKTKPNRYGQRGGSVEDVLSC